MAASGHSPEAAQPRIRGHGIRPRRRAQAIPRPCGVHAGPRGIELTFTAKLIRWYERAKRDFPWRKTSDPYRILVSEVMLQQTRAQTVIPYYEKFLERFPTARSLARAGDTELLRLWSGLGYYQRARNLRDAARQIVRGGGVPRDYDA